VSIVTSLLHANEKENLTTRFSGNKKKTDFKDLFIFIHLPWQRHIRQPSYQKSEVCVVNLRVAIFDDQRIKGF